MNPDKDRQDGRSYIKKGFAESPWLSTGSSVSLADALLLCDLSFSSLALLLYVVFYCIASITSPVMEPSITFI